jgi:ribose/xylose/arabinose/galactoside ABC-type transport system permease subunit
MESARGIKKLLKGKIIVLIFLVIIMTIVYTVLSHGVYIKPFNIKMIIKSAVVPIFLTIGAVYLMICGNIDLSTSMVGNMGAILVALFLSKLGFPWPLAIIATLIVCGGIGALNAYLINSFNFQPFIATMAMSSVVQGVMYLISGGGAVPIKNKALAFIGTYQIGNYIPFPIVLALLALIIYGVVLAKTFFGKSIYMIGGNPRAARLSGLNPTRMSYILFINNAMLGSVAGMLLAFSQKTAMTGAIANAQFSGMTGAILGGVSFGGGSGGMGGAFVGLLLLNGFSNGLTVIGIPAFWQTFASGAVLLVALMFDYINMKRIGRI